MALIAVWKAFLGVRELEDGSEATPTKPANFYSFALVPAFPFISYQLGKIRFQKSMAGGKTRLWRPTPTPVALGVRGPI
jgi:hypothetical protein